MKKCLIIPVLLICCLLSSCISPDYKYSPARQYNTQWQSEDGSIFVSSNDDGYCTGYYQQGEHQVPLQFSFTGFGKVIVCGINDGGGILPYTSELWGVSYKKESFSINVYETTFFDEGEEIVFHLLDEDSTVSYEPVPIDANYDFSPIEKIIKDNSAVLSTTDLDSIPCETMSYNFYTAGIKTIIKAELVDTVNYTLVTIKVTDADGKMYLALVNPKTGIPKSIYSADSLKLLYHKGIVQD